MGTIENRYKITIDLKNRTMSNAKFKQGDTDSSVIEINLVDNGLMVDITGQIIEFNFLKHDNTIVIQDSTTGVSIIDALKGNFQCLLKNNTLAAPGVVKCEIVFKKDGKILSTATFNFNVEASIGNGDGILSTNYISSIENILAVINTAEAARIDAESVRVMSESSRVTKEADRVSKESTRVTNETDRLNSEAIRKSNSEARVAAEIIRVASEGIRVGNENIRLSAEDLRKVAEVLRGTNEADRVNRFNLLTTSQQQAAEVINARTSTTKGKTFASLGDRIESLEVDTTNASYSEELTQNANMFTLGKGKNAVGTDIDVSASVVNGTVKITIEGNTADIYAGGVKADFAGKVAGSVVENPNKQYVSVRLNSLSTPSNITGNYLTGFEESLNYSPITLLDGSTKFTIAGSDSQIPQQLFSFDLIKIYERKYGVIPSVTQSVADKVAWLKANIKGFMANWYGYGSCPSGNKAKFTILKNGVWDSFYDTNSLITTGSPSLVTRGALTADFTLNNAVIDVNGFIHFLAYTDMASTTSPTLLVLSGHGLVANDLIENVTRGSIKTATSIVSVNHFITSSVTNQASGDVVNKYHKQAIDKVSEVGTTSTNVKITEHGLSTGDLVYNVTRGATVQKVTVVDVNNFTVPSIVGQTSGDIMVLYKYYGQQVAESTVIPSTIYTDYVSLDITLKPSYKSVGEDFAGVASSKIGITSKKQDGSVGDSRAFKLAKPLRRVSPTVADVYKEGKVTRKVSEWELLTGDLDWNTQTNRIGYKYARYSLANAKIINGDYANIYARALKNDGSILDYNITSLGGNRVELWGSSCYISFLNADTGFIDSYTPTAAEIKAYFYGYKMCHSDGVSPYQVSEVPYNPTTWAEWIKTGVVGDSTGLEFVYDGTVSICSVINTTLKPLAKYGFLYNVVSNSNVNVFTTGLAFAYASLPKTIGNNKFIKVLDTIASPNTLRLQSSAADAIGSKIKIKDFRIFELPTGSQIETDFNTLTADQLTEKYKFYGLNPKNWKSVVDGSGLTSVLPVAQAPNYTPYKMLYQLATPTTEILNVESTNLLEPSGALPLSCYEKGSLVVDGGSVMPTIKYTVPLNFRAMGMDNNAVIGAIKTYVMQLDSYTTASLLSIADRELRMKSVALLATETTADLKAKINEILNIWKV